MLGEGSFKQYGEKEGREECIDIRVTKTKNCEKLNGKPLFSN